MSDGGPWTVREALTVLVLSLGVFVFAHRSGLANPFVVNDDVRQQIYWMERWRDPALYPPDLLNDYAERYVPIGVKALYRVAAPLVEPLFFSKLLTGALFALTALAFFGLGRTLRDPPTGFAAAAMVWLMPYFLKAISGGLSRSFAPPLLALFLLAMVRRAPRAAAWLLLAAALFIPYTAILCLGLVLCQLVLARLPLGVPAPAFPSARPHYLVLGGAAIMVWGMRQGLDEAGFGPLATLAQMAGRPEFGPLGRLDLYPLPNPFLDLVYWPMEGIGLFLEWGLFPGLASLAVILGLAALGARRAPWAALGPRSPAFLALLMASLVLYLAARVLAYRLFVPDRYLALTVNIGYALALAYCLRQLAAPLLARPRAGAALLVLAAALGAARLDGAGLYDYSAGAPLYAVARETPKNALLAGHPETMDNVLTFGHRDVLASFELAHPWSVGYWEKFAPRLRDFLTAYYAADPEVVRAFAEKYGLFALVVEARCFEPEFLAGRPYFAPYDVLARELAARAPRFALLDPALFPGREVAPGIRLVYMRPRLE